MPTMPTVPEQRHGLASDGETQRRIIAAMDRLLGLYVQAGPPYESPECRLTLHFNCGDSECQCECHDDDFYSWSEAE